MFKRIITTKNNLVDIRVHKIQKINKEYRSLQEDLNKIRLEKLALEKKINECNTMIISIKQRLNKLDSQVIEDLK